MPPPDHEHAMKILQVTREKRECVSADVLRILAGLADQRYLGPVNTSASVHTPLSLLKTKTGAWWFNPNTATIDKNSRQSKIKFNLICDIIIKTIYMYLSLTYQTNELEKKFYLFDRHTIHCPQLPYFPYMSDSKGSVMVAIPHITTSLHTLFMRL